jgi:hypothetical protein
MYDDGATAMMTAAGGQRAKRLADEFLFTTVYGLLVYTYACVDGY